MESCTLTQSLTSAYAVSVFDMFVGLTGFISTIVRMIKDHSWYPFILKSGVSSTMRWVEMAMDIAFPSLLIFGFVLCAGLSSKNLRILYFWYYPNVIFIAAGILANLTVAFIGAPQIYVIGSIFCFCIRFFHFATVFNAITAISTSKIPSVAAKLSHHSNPTFRIPEDNDTLTPASIGSIIERNGTDTINSRRRMGSPSETLQDEAELRRFKTFNLRKSGASAEDDPPPEYFMIGTNCTTNRKNHDNSGPTATIRNSTVFSSADWQQKAKNVPIPTVQKQDLP